ncbi:extracellular solute-binding protein [Homoserinibacter sp. GY 40078]|uniref:extracellular solute-binding protein n=1 Tax=Homoserinibacter sp. GY 40078 TaxID=2603275 RepID=UPI0011C819A3|nr:extracellular solute-binding protein [Homoserinibacter sp. GY 40078]TXK19698.1 extracellular solute-binding protein [Homoserinibacter sp. GY 40078]
MRRRAIIPTIAGLAALTLLAGCSGDGGEQPQAGDDVCASETPVTITFWHTYSTDSAENTQLNDVLLPEFEKECPGVTVDAVVMPYDGLHDQLIAAVSGGGLPDVMRMDIIWTPEFADLGVLTPLDDLDGFSDIANTVLPGPLSTNEFEGQHYGLPLDTNTQVLVYNSELLPEPPTTFEELTADAEALKSQGVYGLALGGAGPWNVFPWFWSAGGTVTDDSYTKATGYLDSAASQAALQWLVDFNDAGLLGPSSIGGSPDSWGGFSGGDYASLSDGPWIFPSLSGDMGDKITGAPLPAGPGGSISVVGGENLVTFATSDKQAAAWEFSKFMLSDFAQGAMAEVGQLPVTQAGLESDAVTSVPYLAAYVQQLQNAQARTPVPAWPQIDQILTDAFTAALRGSKPVDQALSDAASQIDPLLAGD